MTCIEAEGTRNLHKTYLGVDTETYYDEKGKGLKSIQIYGTCGNKLIEKYLLPDSFELPDRLIRMDIASQFFKFIEDTETDMEMSFYNINFDISQVLQFMVTDAGYDIKHIDDTSRFVTKKGELSILESERCMYSVSIRTRKHGRLVKMIDLYNFMPGTTLDSAAKAWLGDEKIKDEAIASKKFPKKMPTEIEKKYAMKDAELTYRLFMALKSENVIEGQKYVTIAGRTMGHFREFLKSEFNIGVDEYFWQTDDREEIKYLKKKTEGQLRSKTRGGACMAWHKGMYYHCTHIDARSMYPSQCVRDFIPIGAGLKEPPLEPYSYVVYPVGLFKLKPGKVPYFQWRKEAQCMHYRYIKEYEPGDYVSDCMLDGTYCVWEEEWKIIKDTYDIEQLDESNKLYFKMIENIPLKQYVQMLYTGKKINKGAKRLFFKYLLNALYGKFLSNPDGVAIDYIDGKRVKVEEKDRKTYYLPLGMWIAAMGRVTLFKAIASIPEENFLYCDTDSIIYKGDIKPDVVIGEELGMWGIEAEDVTVNIIGPKTYQEQFKDGSYITKCAGMPRAIKDEMPWGGIYEGFSIKCRKPRRDPMTLAINFEETEFTVNTRAQIFKSR